MNEIKNFTISPEEIIKYSNNKNVYSSLGLTYYYSDDNDSFFLEAPVRTHSIAVIACIKGGGFLNCNGKKLELISENITILPPGTISYLESGFKNSQFVGLLINSDFFKEGSLNLSIDVKLLIEIISAQVIKLNSDKFNNLVKIIDIVKDILKESNSINCQEKAVCVIRLLIYSLKEAVEEKKETKVIPNNKNTIRKNEQFSQFITLVGENYLLKRGVEFYAKEMCMSPKYLACVIKDITGFTVKEWIDKFILLEAKSMLKFSSLSIMEIGDHLNFSSPSSFGKYFKKNTGLTPGEYRDN